MKKKWSFDEITYLIQNYAISGSNAIAKSLNRTKISVEQKAYRLHLYLNKDTKSEILKKSRIKEINHYKIQKHFDLTDIRICYFLGFLWSDGYIDKKKPSFGIEANADDMNEVFKHIKHVGCWNIYERKRKNWKRQLNINSWNPFIYDFMIKNDFLQKSNTSPDKLLKIIPQENYKYFILGVIDGDGCIYYNKKHYSSQLTITSTYDQDWTYLINFFKNRHVKFRIVRSANKNPYSIIRITNKKDILKICDELYENYHDNEIGLKRKFDKYCQIKDRK